MGLSALIDILSKRMRGSSKQSTLEETESSSPLHIENEETEGEREKLSWERMEVERLTKAKRLSDWCDAVINGEEDLALLLLTDDLSSEIRKPLDNGGTENHIPLTLAAQYGMKRCVSRILELGAEIDDTTYYGKTALSVVAFSELTDMARFLIDLGANPNGYSDSGSSFPLILAAQFGNSEMVDLLLRSGADPFLRERSVIGRGWSPLLRALTHGNKECAELLIKAGVDLMDCAFEPGQSPLGHCIQKGRGTETLELALDRGCDVNGSEGNPPLIRALKERQFDCVNLLLERGADPSLKNEDGDAALHTALKYSATTEIVKAIIDSGANVNEEGEKGYTPLMLMTAPGGDSEEKRLKVMTLLRAGADPHMKNSKGESIEDIKWIFNSSAEKGVNLILETVRMMEESSLLEDDARTAKSGQRRRI